MISVADSPHNGFVWDEENLVISYVQVGDLRWHLKETQRHWSSGGLSASSCGAPHPKPGIYSGRMSGSEDWQVSSPLQNISVLNELHRIVLVLLFYILDVGNGNVIIHAVHQVSSKWCNRDIVRFVLVLQDFLLWQIKVATTYLSKILGYSYILNAHVARCIKIII